MERNTQKIGLLNLLLLLAAAGLTLALALYSGTLSGQVASAIFGIGFLIAAISYFQMRLEDRERLERLDFDELKKSKSAESLFTGSDEETLPAYQSRLQFDKYFVPGFALLVLVLEGLAAGLFWRWLSTVTVTAPKEPTIALALYSTLAIILFVLGKYAANLAKFQGQQLLRPAASFLVLGFYLAAAMAICIGWVWSGGTKADFILARSLCVLLGLIATETLVNLVLEIYRPRVKGQQSRLIYESRLVGLLGQPEGIFSTAAQALDYQFGFKVSETWFYQFLQKAIAWIILLQFGVLVVSTVVVFIGPGEQGLIERFGKPIAGGNILEPGPHLKLPWPIDTIHRFRTQEIQSFNIGFANEEKETHKVVLWTVKHYKEEFNLLVASKEQSQSGTNAVERAVPADLLTISIPVQFQIKDLLAWEYNHTDASKLLEKIATREVVRFLVGADIFELMSSGRDAAAQDLKRLIQERSDEYKLGVNIVFVGLQDIHPPVKVAPKFEEVVAARQESEARLRIAEGYAARVVTLAKAEAEKKIHEAEAYRARKIAGAAAQGEQFTSQLLAYQAAPEVYLQRSYLNAFSRGSANARKYIVTATNTQDVVILNLEDKIRSDILDIPMPSVRK